MSRALRKLTRLDAAVAVLLGVLYAVVLLRTTGTLGYARDEGIYFHAASSYGRWLSQLWDAPGQAMTRKAIDAAWANNHEHPALIKTLFALSNLWLQKKLSVFSMEGTSFRFPAIALAGALVGLLYVWGCQARSRVAGLAASCLFALMPRVFFHAHLACFDVPIVAVWTGCAYTFWRAVCTHEPKQGGRRASLAWPLATALLFGLALNTKHNSWFLPIVMAAHTGLLWAAARMLPPDMDAELWRARRQRAMVTLGLMAVIGPLVFVALWPWLWHDTAARIREYAKFHLNHDYYNMEFLGTSYWTPPMPRLYAPVMTAATVPLITLLLFFAGLSGRLRAWAKEGAARLSRGAGGQRLTSKWLVALARLGGGAPKLGPGAPTELLWLLSIGAIYGVWLLPKTPIFGGTKHWMTAYPFMALFAAIGFDDLWRAARARVLTRWRERAEPIWGGVSIVLFASVLASPLVQTARSHPWGLSAYTPLVGGAPGAATLGLNRTFWGYSTGAITGYLNTAPPGTEVYLHDTIAPAWDMLRTDGRLRKDLRGAAAVDPSTMALYHHEKHMSGIEYQAWVAYGTVRPDHIAGLDGVPVLWVYRRPGR